MGDYTELRRLAEGATPEPWHVCDDGWIGAGSASITDHGECIGVLYLNDAADLTDADAAYIAAANPAAVLALLADRDLLVSRLEEAERLLSEFVEAWDRRMVSGVESGLMMEIAAETTRAFLAPAPTTDEGGG